jgi:hypothetical protein
MAVTVVGLDNLRGALSELEVAFGDGARGRRQLLTRLTRAFRDATRNNISRQSGNGVSWKRLSNWTVAKTGRRKALITLRDRIKTQVNKNAGIVYFEQDHPRWNLTMHHKGFTSRAVKGKRMSIPIRFPAINIAGRTRNLVSTNDALGSRLVITKRKASVIPPRPVWPEGKEAGQLVNKGLQDYLAFVRRQITLGRRSS